jgi:DNA polymerase III delta prime subunit
LDEIHPKLASLNTQPEASGFLKGLLDGAYVSSLLFVGPEGAGKRTYATAFVKSLFCRNGVSCPGCADCRQVDAKTHPDLLWVQKGFFWPVEEEKKSNVIPVDVVSGINEKLSLAPMNAPLKIVVVPDAHLMNESAQDKFLKTLEEPPRRGLILLLTDQPASLRSTIQSRCRIVRFKPLSIEAAENVLRGRGMDSASSKAAALISGGNLKRAFLYADADWRAFLDKAPVDFSKALEGDDESWMRVVDEYEKLDPGFWDDEDLTAAQRKKKVAEEFLRAALVSWDTRVRENRSGKALPTVDPTLVRASIRRHLDWLSGNLSVRMVLDHLFMEVRDIVRTGRNEPLSWMDSALRP